MRKTNVHKLSLVFFFFVLFSLCSSFPTVNGEENAQNDTFAMQKRQGRAAAVTDLEVQTIKKGAKDFNVVFNYDNRTGCESVGSGFLSMQVSAISQINASCTDGMALNREVWMSSCFGDFETSYSIVIKVRCIDSDQDSVDSVPISYQTGPRRTWSLDITEVTYPSVVTASNYDDVYLKIAPNLTDSAFSCAEVSPSYMSGALEKSIEVRWIGGRASILLDNPANLNPYTLVVRGLPPNTPTIVNVQRTCADSRLNSIINSVSVTRKVSYPIPSISVHLNSNYSQFTIESGCSQISVPNEGWTTLNYQYSFRINSITTVTYNCTLVGNVVTCFNIPPFISNWITVTATCRTDGGQPNRVTIPLSYAFNVPGYNMEYYQNTTGIFSLSLGTSQLRVDIPEGALPGGSQGFVYSSDPRSLRFPPSRSLRELMNISFVLSAYNSSGVFGGALKKNILIYLDTRGYTNQSAATNANEFIYLWYNYGPSSYQSRYMNCVTNITNGWIDEYTFRINICHFSEFYPVIAKVSSTQSSSTYRRSSSRTPNNVSNTIGIIIGCSIGGCCFLLIASIVICKVVICRSHTTGDHVPPNSVIPPQQEMREIILAEAVYQQTEVVPLPQNVQSPAYTPGAYYNPKTDSYNPDYAPSAPPSEKDIG